MRLAVFPFVMSILGLFASGFSFGSLLSNDHNPMKFELVILCSFMFVAFIFILLLSIGFPFKKGEVKIVP